MAKYKIKNNFNFRVKRSDKKRPVVVVDAAHLGGAYKGTFVSASTLDGAGCILPLAYGVVDTENDCSWTWFFENFKNAFGERENMCIVSDRNESIIKSVSIVYPNVPHCACIWHLWKNVCSSFKRSKKTLSDIFYSMAKAYRKEDFDKLMAKVVKVDHRVKDYLEEAGYEKWSRVHSTINRGRMMTSNIAECINGCLVDARKLTIIDFLEEARLLFGSWNYKNREIASYTKDTLGRRFEEILIVNASKSSKMKVVPSSEYIFTVHEAGKRYIVCLERKTCTCGRFQHDEIPCAHAIAVLKHKNVTNLHPYCSDYYKPYALEKTYEVVMVPMPDKDDWNVPEYVLDEIVRPPRYRRLAGRPRKRRKKNADEKITVNNNCCGQCGQEGHNRRTCTFFPKED
ncbi:protein FAR-RED IMPAIRED RESPONSE 1-like isoform X2 [Solanum pennellii]|uniref:Protein FAR-RED IMPAIRED RESPONSE 1-like isoform X2 n=1 Tax=Solanum pennellii TaxID=28526 RepID=A0ABM1V2D6_SOLPN|nr:protein FAR-RED IMPAIRED RESPONSE 1-like isoform X2 [Solanum pennellii]